MNEKNTFIDNLLMGEDSGLELKSVNVPGKRVTEPDTKDMADEIAAAANFHGAKFVLGVHDKTKVIEGIPLDKLDVVETWIRDICNDSIKPSVPAQIKKERVIDAEGNAKYVICVNVAQSLFVHKSPHGYFYRIGSSKREMSPEYLARLLQQRSQTRMICFDEQMVASASREELKPQLYTRFKSQLSPADDEEFLRKLHFIVRDEVGAWHPTVGAVLMACDHPEEFLPSAMIQAVAYRGAERNAADQLDARDIVGPIDLQIAEACRFVARNMRVAAVKMPGRVDIPQFAINAVFEAIVNAVAHRDYSISGAKIRLHMFADRLEIFSPGGLPNSLTLEEIGERQFSRNELICSCLARCPLTESYTEIVRTRIMDRRGEGVPVILSATEKLAGKRPFYQLYGNDELKLTIPSIPIEDRAALERIAAALLKARQSGGQRRNSGIDRIVELVRENPQITQAQMAEACGVSRATIAKWLARSNVIVRVGGDFGGRWEEAKVS